MPLGVEEGVVRGEMHPQLLPGFGIYFGFLVAAKGLLVFELDVFDSSNALQPRQAVHRVVQKLLSIEDQHLLLTEGLLGVFGDSVMPHLWFPAMVRTSWSSSDAFIFSV